MSQTEAGTDGESDYVDQTPWLLGLSFLSGEGVALAARSRSDRVVDCQLGLAAVR